MLAFKAILTIYNINDLLQKAVHDVLSFRKEIDGITVDIALQWQVLCPHSVLHFLHLCYLNYFHQVSDLSISFWHLILTPYELIMTKD